jgi:hypothetical protein
MLCYIMTKNLMEAWIIANLSMRVLHLEKCLLVLPLATLCSDMR